MGKECAIGSKNSEKAIFPSLPYPRKSYTQLNKMFELMTFPFAAEKYIPNREVRPTKAAHPRSIFLEASVGLAYFSVLGFERIGHKLKQLVNSLHISRCILG